MPVLPHRDNSLVGKTNTIIFRCPVGAYLFVEIKKYLTYLSSVGADCLLTYTGRSGGAERHYAILLLQTGCSYGAIKQTSFSFISLCALCGLFLCALGG
jgi:hypothetical protein